MVGLRGMFEDWSEYVEGLGEGVLSHRAYYYAPEKNWICLECGEIVHIDESVGSYQRMKWLDILIEQDVFQWHKTRVYWVFYSTMPCPGWSDQNTFHKWIRVDETREGNGRFVCERCFIPRIASRHQKMITKCSGVKK